RLGALRYLNLQHFGIDQVVRRHAETAGSNLLDLGHTLGAKTGRVFTTLTGIRATTKAVHRRGNGFMRFRRESTERHAGGVEAQQDILDRLDVVHRHPCDTGLQREQIPDGGHATVVDQRGERLVILVITRGNGLVDGVHHVRVIGVVFLAMDVLEHTAGIDRLALLPGILLQDFLVVLEVDKLGTGDTALYAAETDIHHFARDTD